VLSILKNFLNKHFGPGSAVYGILKPCRRCTYQGPFESILIVSKERGPRIIILPGKQCYRRIGDCIGYKKCGKCFEAVEGNDKSLPCKWIKF